MSTDSTSTHCCAPSALDAAASAPAMTVAALKRALAARPELPLTVLWPDGDSIDLHFHVTEVGRVQKDFVDCGGTVRRTVTCLLQTWVGEDVDHRITAGKLLKAFEHSAAVLGSEDLAVELEYEACNVIQFTVTAVEDEGDRLVVRLGSKHTACLAKEACGVVPKGAVVDGCCGGNGCG